MQDSDKHFVPAPGEGGEKPQASAEAEAADQALAADKALAASQALAAKRAKAKKEIREWVVSIAVALIAVFLIRSFLFTVIRVEGDSMRETLHNGERLIVSVLDVKLGGVDRGDVVICHFPGRTGLLGFKQNFVKRVVGVAGDEIVMLGGQTFVNGERVDESFVTHPSLLSGAWRVPEGHLFVSGDNRANSRDSRSEEVGYIPEGDIVGKVRLVMWPVSAWRMVE